MEIIIIGRPKEGKTIVATRVKELVESLGGSVIWDDVDPPKLNIPRTFKALSYADMVKITVRDRREPTAGEY